MPSTQRSDLIYPEVLTEEVQKGIASGLPVLLGSKAVVMNPGLQNGRGRVGSDIRVPYFSSIGKAQEIAEGGALTPKKLEQSSESGVVVHLGDALSINALAEAVRASGKDIYQVAREMLISGLVAKIDDILVSRAAARAVAASMVYDGSGANISPSAIVGTMKKFGDELSRPMMAQWVMTSGVTWDLAQLADSMGRPLYVANAGQAPAQINNVPVMMSDKSDLSVASTTPQQYYSLLLKEGALAAWLDSDGISIEIDRDSLADDTLLVYHVYGVFHAYGTMAGGTKAGVAAMKTLASA